MIGGLLQRTSSLRDRIEPALFLLLSCVQAAIVLVAARPPMRDAPVYEVTFTMLAQPPSTRTWFAPDLEGSQGSLIFALGRELSRVLEPQAAYQLMMACGVLGLPLAFRALCTAIGRGALVSWIALPLSFHAGLFLGELRVTVALPIALLQIACAVGLLRASVKTFEIAQLLLSVVLFFSHSGLWAAALSVAFLSLIFRSDVPLLVRARGPFVAVLAAVAAVALFDLTWLSTFDDDFRFILADCEPSARLRDVSMFTTFTLQGDSTDRLTKAWVVLVALAIGLALTSAKLTDDSRRLRLFVASAAGLAFLAFVLLPADFDATWGWGIALGGLCALLLLAALPLPSGWIRTVLLAGFSAIAMWRSAQVNEAFYTFKQKEVRDFSQVLGAVPKRRHLLVLISDPYSKVVHVPALLNFGAFYQALSPEGLVAPIVGELPGWPISLRDAAPRPPLPEQSTLFATGYVYPATLEWADYVLTRGEWATRPAERAKLLYDGSGWKLYRIMPPVESFRAPKN